MSNRAKVHNITNVIMYNNANFTKYSLNTNEKHLGKYNIIL